MTNTANATAARAAWETGRVMDTEGIVHRLDEPGLAVCGPIDSAVSTLARSDCPGCNPTTMERNHAAIQVSTPGQWAMIVGNPSPFRDSQTVRVVSVGDLRGDRERGHGYLVKVSGLNAEGETVTATISHQNVILPK